MASLLPTLAHLVGGALATVGLQVRPLRSTSTANSAHIVAKHGAPGSDTLPGPGLLFDTSAAAVNDLLYATVDGSTFEKFDPSGDAALVAVTDAGGFYTGSTVEAVLAEQAPYLVLDVADPGDGEAIPVAQSAHIAFTTGGAGETGTLAAPTFVGQKLVLALDVDGGGNRVVTAAAAVNQAGNNTLTFADAGDILVLEAVQIGGSPVWRITANDGVALTTV